jgi:glycosyltransferase involved in cell wall biosynthesis
VKLLMNVDQLGPNSGITVEVHQIAAELAARGHAIDLLHIEGGPYYSSYQALCRSVTAVPAFDFYPGNPIRSAYHVAPAVVRGVQRRPDVVYVNRFLPLAWARSVGTLSRSPVVCHVHGMTGATHPIVNRVLGHGLHRIIAVSDYVRQEFVKVGVRAEAIRVIHNGIDLAEYPAGGREERAAARESLGLPADAYIALLYGRIGPSKGPEVLADAAAQVAKQVPDLQLLYVGRPIDEGYVAQLRQRAGDALVHWLPSRVDVVTPLHAADVVVVPSMWEDPLPRAVIEGLATGRPVVASAVGGIPEMLQDTFPDHLFARGDTEALGALLVRLAGWRDSSPDLGAQGVELVRQRFSLTQMVDSIERELIDARGR